MNDTPTPTTTITTPEAATVTVTSNPSQKQDILQTIEQDFKEVFAKLRIDASSAEEHAEAVLAYIKSKF